MAKVSLKLQPQGGLLKQLGGVIAERFGRKARDNAADIRPFVESAIIQGVANTKGEFIPSDSDAVELGIGESGNIDRSRTHGAWKQLLPQNQAGITTFSVNVNRSKLNFRKRLKIVDVNINIDEDAFLDAELSRVPTPDSKLIDEIPWMRWMIRGAPVIGRRFLSGDFPEVSRTGRGIMIKGGTWTFAPVNLDAFSKLEQAVEKEVVREISKNVGKVVR